LRFPCISGKSKPPHGDEFKKWSKLAMRRIADVEITTTHEYEISYRYEWHCSNPSCSFVVKRHSKSVDTKKHCCGRCQSILIEKKSTSASKRRAQPSAYNLFVKEQSKIIRQKILKQKKTVVQGDVMKECARLWREKKENL
jgi:hypothetical protein